MRSDSPEVWMITIAMACFIGLNVFCTLSILHALSKLRTENKSRQEVFEFLAAQAQRRPDAIYYVVDMNSCELKKMPEMLSVVGRGGGGDCLEIPRTRDNGGEGVYIVGSHGEEPPEH